MKKGNIFRCGYNEIFIISAKNVGKNFVSIEWVRSQNFKEELFTTICHINKIDLQISIGGKFGDTHEVGGVRVNRDGYLKVLNLLGGLSPGQIY